MIALQVFLHGAKNNNSASWMLASRVLTFMLDHVWKTWPFVPSNLGSHLSLLMDLKVRAENN